MFTLIEARNFRCLHHIRQSLAQFNVLVGPNASGKTTFLDVIGFLGDLVSAGLEEAVFRRTANFVDLTWRRNGEPIELAVEAQIPREYSSILDPLFLTIRYEVCIALEQDTNEIIIQKEKVILKKKQDDYQHTENYPLFPNFSENIGSILAEPTPGNRTIVSKVSGQNDNFHSEVVKKSKKEWVHSFKLGPHRSALANLPEDESRFPVATWLKKTLNSGIQQLMLNSLLLRRASPPGQSYSFKPDGSNLPWVIESLWQNHPEKFQQWLDHIRTSLPDIEHISTIERPEDRHRYLMIRYRGGLDVPAWMASDGTLRLLALTIPAYLPELSGVFLIEEPENGVHPRAVETLCQSLSSVYNAQVIMATHSPVILSQVEARQILCFAKTPEGATDIVRGDRHPALRDWRGETDIGTLFAAGVLG